MTESLSYWLQKLTSVEFWIEFISYFKDLGPIPAIFMAFIESLIPALPLVAIVTFNITVHGVVLGFFYSWIGTTLGSLVVFLFFRRVLRKHLLSFLEKRKNINKALQWVAGRDQEVLFALIAIPFTPSSFINIAFGLSHFPEKVFIKTLVVGKLIMMTGLSFFGNIVTLAFGNPIYVIVALVILYGLVKISAHFRKKHGL